MRDLICAVEEALGAERLLRLRRDDDAIQQFWLGVLEATTRVDWSKETLGFFISNGYGAVRNMRRSENSRGRFRYCPDCGATYGYRTRTCRRCGAELLGRLMVVSLSAPNGDGWDVEDRRRPFSVDLRVDVEAFVRTLDGGREYVARRWLVDRADLLYANHLTQIAFEMGVSKPRVAKLKGEVRDAFRRWWFGT